MTKKRRINKGMCLVALSSVAGILYPLWVGYLNPTNILADPEVGGALLTTSIFYWLGVIGKLFPDDDK